MKRGGIEKLLIVRWLGRRNAAVTRRLAVHMRHDLHHCCGSEPRMPIVTLARQRNRNLRSKNNPRRQRIGEKGELPGDHIARFKIGSEQDVRLANHSRADSNDSRGFGRDRLIDCQWAFEDAAGDLAPLRHLAERRRLDRGRHAGIDRFHRREHRYFWRSDSEPSREIDRILADFAFLGEPRRDVDHRVGDK